MKVDAGLAPWIRLALVSGVGSETGRKLLHVFGLPENIFGATAHALREVVSERVAQTLLSPLDDATKAHIDKTLEWAELPGNYLITLADSTYPAALLEIPDPPLVLYAKGRVELLGAKAVAIVGSRNATAQGASNAENFAQALSRAGLTIISGMALGIDTAAHRGALRGATGSTVAVIGTGADIVYPSSNRGLAHQIADEGCILSEYPLGTPAIAANFPRRNRLISGLARGVLVVEAAAQSGSLITARMALEQGRDVFAIPGSIHSPLSKGCHQLIKQGAKLVENAQDILEELAPHSPQILSDFPATSLAAPAADSIASEILDAMGFDPVTMHVLAERVPYDSATLTSRLLMLELDGLVEQLPGGIVRRLA